jgi:glycerophosphoryl diester phosphodiesterase
MVECDIRQAYDGELVLAHDPQVKDVHGRQYVIAEHSSDVLQGLDLGAGEGVPLLSELVAMVSGRGAIMADMKTEGGDVEERVVEALRGLPLEAKLVPGAAAESRARFLECDPTLPLSLSLNYLEIGAISRPDWLDWVVLQRVQAVTWQFPFITQQRVEALQSKKIQVFAWTVDSAETMHALLALGVDGIISNRVDMLTSTQN